MILNNERQIKIEGSENQVLKDFLEIYDKLQSLTKINLIDFLVSWKKKKENIKIIRLEGNKKELIESLKLICDEKTVNKIIEFL